MPWRKHALELAKQIRAEDPGKHILNVAAEISSQWQRDSVRCPGTGKLIRAIREGKNKESSKQASIPSQADRTTPSPVPVKSRSRLPKNGVKSAITELTCQCPEKS
jgi:hypothetical protein